MPTNPTPAEIAALERDIAERVMGWIWTGRPAWKCPGRKPSYRFDDFHPWHNPADALEVLKRLAKRHPGFIELIENEDGGWRVRLAGNDELSAAAPGPHYGPAVCLLAQKVMENSK